MTSHIENIPIDLWSLVGKHLDVVDLCRLRICSKKLNEVISGNDLCWKHSYGKLTANRVKIIYAPSRMPWRSLCKRLILGSEKNKAPYQIEFEKIFKNVVPGRNKFQVIFESDPNVIVGSIKGECYLLNVFDESVIEISPAVKSDRGISIFTHDSEHLSRFTFNLPDGEKPFSIIKSQWSLSSLKGTLCEEVLDLDNKCVEFTDSQLQQLRSYSELVQSAKKGKCEPSKIHEIYSVAKKCLSIIQKATDPIPFVELMGRLSEMKRNSFSLEESMDDNWCDLIETSSGSIFTREDESPIETHLEGETFITVIRSDGTVQVQDFGSLPSTSPIKQAKSNFVHSKVKPRALFTQGEEVKSSGRRGLSSSFNAAMQDSEDDSESSEESLDIFG